MRLRQAVPPPALLASQRFNILPTSHSLTSPSFLLYAPACIAPQFAHCRQRSYGMAADYWALGVLTFEMLTGQTPFRRSAETSELEVLEAITAHRIGGLETAGAWGAGARAAAGDVDGATGAAPRRATATARGLVERLLDPDEDSRLRFISPARASGREKGAHATASVGGGTSGAGAQMSFRNHPWFQQVALAEWTDDAVMQRIATEATRHAAPSGAASASYAKKKKRDQIAPTCAVEDAKQLAQQKDDTIRAAGGVDALLE